MQTKGEALSQWCSNHGPRVTGGPQSPLEWPM